MYVCMCVGWGWGVGAGGSANDAGGGWVCEQVVSNPNLLNKKVWGFVSGFRVAVGGDPKCWVSKS